MAPRMTGAERREQLLDATKAIVVADGFHAVSIEAVARAAGITRPIVYGHFRDLGGLLEALVERESRRALSQLPETYDDLLAALTAYLGAVKSDPDTWRLVLMPQEGAPRLLHERRQKVLGFVEVLRRVLVEDDDVSLQALDAPVFLREQELADKGQG